jgi:hypothetical protein
MLGILMTDEHVVTLLAEHTIILPSRRLHINFHVCVLHLKNIHTIVSSLQNLFGIPSLQQLAFNLYHGVVYETTTLPLYPKTPDRFLPLLPLRGVAHLAHYLTFSHHKLPSVRAPFLDHDAASC